MNEMIKIYDNLIPKVIEDKIEDFVLHANIPIFCYKNNVTGGNQEKFLPGIAHTFWTKENQVSEHSSFLMQPLYIFNYLQNINVYQLYTSRVFITFPLKNTKINHIHNDQPFPHFVCIYYINNTDGDTIFYNEQREEIKRVSPKRGRIVFFNGNIKHSGSSPTKNTRAIINYNFYGESYEK